MLVRGSQSCFTPVPAKFPFEVWRGDWLGGCLPRRPEGMDCRRSLRTSSLIWCAFCLSDCPILLWNPLELERIRIPQALRRSVVPSVVGRVSEIPASDVAPMRFSPLLSAVLASLPALSFPRSCLVRAARPPLRQVRLDLLGSVTPNGFVTLGWESKEAIFCAILSRLGRETLEQVVVAG